MALQQARCRSCGATILWGETVRGKRTPVNVRPVTIFVEDRDLRPGRTLLRALAGYVSHFATCPRVQEHRKKKRDQAILDDAAREMGDDRSDPF